MRQLKQFAATRVVVLLLMVVLLHGVAQSGVQVQPTKAKAGLSQGKLELVGSKRARVAVRVCPSPVPAAPNSEYDRALDTTYRHEFPELQRLVSYRRWHCIAWCESGKGQSSPNLFQQIGGYWLDRAQRFNLRYTGDPAHPPVMMNRNSPFDSTRVSAMLMIEAGGPDSDWGPYSGRCWRDS